MLKRLSLSQKQLAVVATSGSIVLLLLCLFQVYYSYTVTKSVHKRNANELMQLAELSAALSLWNMDESTGRELVNGATSNELIRSAKILLPDGKMFASAGFKREQSDQKIAEFLFSDIVHQSRNLYGPRPYFSQFTDKQQLIGTIALDLDISTVWDDFISQLSTSVYLLLMQVVVLLFFVGLFLNVLLVGPLSRVAIKISNVDPSNPADNIVSVPDVHKSDELGSLVKSFNATLNKLAETQNHLRSMALYDTITGLPNRNFLFDHLKNAILQSSESSQSRRIVTLFIDLDGFKVVNDLYGHEVGDEVVAIMAKRLKDKAKDGDIVTRFGGDEFVIILDGVTGDMNDQYVLDTCSRLLQAIALPISIDQKMIKLSASIGISFYPDHADNVESLVKYADTAMYDAKHAGGNCATIFAKQSIEKIEQFETLKNALSCALDNDEFELYFQPIIHAQDPPKLSGFESLLRWRHHGEIIPPSNFISVAENTKEIISIGRWVLKETIAGCKRAVEVTGGKPITFNVNVSPVQLQWDADFVHFAIKEFLDSGLEGGSIVLEITENTLAQDPESITKILYKLVAAGYRIAVDDFGTGYSNLVYLENFPVHSLKIDGAFVSRLPGQSSAILGILSLAKALNLSTVAEQVETEEQAEWLFDNGVDKLQGYLYGKPDTLNVALTLSLEGIPSLKSDRMIDIDRSSLG